MQYEHYVNSGNFEVHSLKSDKMIVYTSRAPYDEMWMTTIYMDDMRLRFNAFGRTPIHSLKRAFSNVREFCSFRGVS